MSSLDRLGNVGASYVDFSRESLAGAPPGSTTSGIGQFGKPALVTGTAAIPATSTNGGDVQLGGSAVVIDDPLSRSDQENLNQIKSFEGIPASAVSMDPKQSMSLNDMAAELTIMILQNAQSIKAIEREMKAELAAVQFQNGMKMADMIEKRGELAFQKAVTEAVTKMTSAVASIAAQKIGEKLATPKTTQGEGRSQLGLGQGDGSKFIPGQKSQLTEAQKMAVQSTGKMCNDLAKAMVEATGTLIAAHLDLDISKIDAEKQVMETMNKLIDSVISSVDSSIRSQDSAISFAMNLLQQLNSLAADGCNKIINNMR